MKIPLRLARKLGIGLVCCRVGSSPHAVAQESFQPDFAQDRFDATLLGIVPYTVLFERFPQHCLDGLPHDVAWDCSLHDSAWARLLGLP